MYKLRGDHMDDRRNNGKTKDEHMVRKREGETGGEGDVQKGSTSVTAII